MKPTFPFLGIIIAVGFSLFSLALCPYVAKLPTDFVLERTVASGKSTRTISYALHPNDISYRYNNTFNLHYQCSPSPDRLPLPEPIEKVLNFTTTVSTSLKIMIMGDSVGVQIAQGFQEAAGATFEKRQVLRYSWGTHEGLSLAAPVRGGGQVAAWRITGMLTEKGENRALPNKAGGGWVRSDVMALLNYSSNVENSNGEENQVTGPFDSMVFRIPHGWLRLARITKKSLLQTTKLAHELFGVSTVVFVSLPFVNNIQTLQDLTNLRKANEMLRAFAQGWNAKGVKHVLVLEFGRLMDKLMEFNARLLGFNTSFQNYTMERLSAGKLNQSIPHVCGIRSYPGAVSCTENSITRDGMHWCLESVGGRVFAGIACLLGCAHNGPMDEDEMATDVRLCESRCNAQFMSLEEAGSAGSQE